ncbi:MAG TPA: retropepsin-like aspartic protease [Prolixibacteraceae bacterium]|nr:retropepsin-like aspartic protease [Prolixibacteraceae bacterium]HPS13319.1 retropepsin-like aspartic protease [Prolixibacteraceae bacterium]
MGRKKKIEIPLRLVELENENYHIMVETHFADGFRGMWIVDTGASRTVLDSNLESYFIPVETPLTEMESMGIGSEKLDTKSGVIETIYFDGNCMKNLHIALIDLSAINQLYQKFTQETITGLIGSDFLVHHEAVIDFKKMVMQFYL